MLRNLQSASGELDTFLTRLRPFAAAGPPAFKALGEISVVGRRAVLKTDEEVTSCASSPRTRPASPSRCASSSRRSTTASGRWSRTAARRATGPPAGDKTHTTSSRAGFTGMEAIWNYFYWQTLSTNALDDVGHVLRLSIAREPVLAIRR